MKYTIELTNKQKAQMDCMIDIVHRYVGFNPKLEPIKTTNVEDTNEYQIGYKTGRKDGFAYCRNNTELIDELKQAEYNRGLEDAWKFAKKIALNEIDGGYPSDTLSEIFDATYYDTLANNTIYEVKEKIKTYEEKKNAEEKIKIGDEVKDLATNNIGVVLSMTEQRIVYMTRINKINRVYSNTRGSLEKTGRHFEIVDELLDQLRGNKDEKD